MRFLCLHGRGTNAAIFKDQTAKICDVIGQDNEFVYIDGHIAADVVPAIGSIAVSQESERFAFVPLDAEPDVYRAFFLELRDFIESQGPFDGMMGFSEGASIAMTMVAEDSRRPFAYFKCAIFFCALAALDPDCLSSQPITLRYLEPALDQPLIHIPTAHIWSANDEVARGVSQRIADLCDKNTRQVLTHDLGHDIPGSRSDENLAAALRVIERTIESGRG